MTTQIPFDSLTLKAVADELSRTVVRGYVQRIVQYSQTEIVLSIRAQGATFSLLLSCDARFARACLTHVHPPAPTTPPAFCMLCRKHLEGAKVVSVAQRGFDRILDISIEGPEGPAILVAEIMGKHSNLLLVSPDGIILDAAKHVSHQQSRRRETLPGKRYVAPPPQEGRIEPFGDREGVVAFLDGLPQDEEAAEAALMARIAGLSPFLAREIALRRATSDAEGLWQAVFGAAAEYQWNPVLVRNASAEPSGAYPITTVQVDPGRQNPRSSISDAVDQAFRSAQTRAELDQVAQETRGLITRALAARRRQARDAAAALEQVERAPEIRRQGETILACQTMIEPGAKTTTLPDLYGGSANITIPLDPTKTPAENAEECFRRYRKLQGSADALRLQSERTSRDESALSAALAQVEVATNPHVIREIRRQLTTEGLLREEPAAAGARQGRPVAFDGKKIRTVRTPEGWEILVGENSEANDFLTTRVAAPNDIWLHVRANTSAHVVIRTGNAPNRVPHTVIEAAARLAAQHSAAKHSSMVPVDWTLRKYVRRPRGAASGTVHYRGEHTVYVDPRR